MIYCEIGGGSIIEVKCICICKRFIASACAAQEAASQPARGPPDPPLQHNLSSPEFREAMQQAIGEPRGVIDRVVASAELPFGPTDPHNPLCKPLWDRRRVAVVGNGPLSDADREDIGACDGVVRFNLLNNLRWGLECTDVWVTRFSPVADNHSEGYWVCTFLHLLVYPRTTGCDGMHIFYKLGIDILDMLWLGSYLGVLLPWRIWVRQCKYLLSSLDSQVQL